MNKAILVGRLTANPELRVTPGGANVCSFSIAVDRRFVRQGEERKTDFINCVAWNKTAEFICGYFTKGRFIGVVGSIQTRDWTDQNGNKRYATEVIVDEAYFTESKASAASSGAAPQPRANTNSFNQNAGAYNQNASSGAFDSSASLPDGADFAVGISDDDLPF